MALKLEHPVYHCLYLALAESIEGKVITADRRLLESVLGTSWENLLEAVAAD